MNDDIPISDFSSDDFDDEEDEPQPQLSAPRVVIAILLALAVLVGAGWTVRSSLSATPRPAAGTTWFAPYVDATLTPPTQFQDANDNPARQVALGFVVADPHHGCTPSWGTYYTLDQAASSLNLDSRIAQVRTEGGNVLVSFGGQAHSELALTCTSTQQLTAAYRSVISHYQLTAVDFDIEGTTLADTAATRRRAAALAALQHAARAAHKRLDVWLTLPVATTGLAPDAQTVVADTLAAGVHLAGINVMAMDFGTPESHMGDTVIRSLRAANGQLDAIGHRYGLPAGAGATWGRMGVTVMIGQNDTDGEIFTVADARQLVGFVRANRVRRVSMWSLNRDIRCGTTFAVIGVHSNTCSGSNQRPRQFSALFAHLDGSMATPAATATAGGRAAPSTTDNPATSPYPIWSPTRPYPAGYKVVRDGDVYQAKWYTQGDDPAAQVQYVYQTPWQLIGPVLPGERAPTTTTLPKGTYPTWSATAVYQAGDRVLYEGKPYQAKWYNKATSPGAENADPTASPWQPRFTIPGEPTNG